MPFLVGGTRQNLILTFNAITAMAKSETRCPARLTHQVSPCTPIHTPDTRGGKLRPLCCQLSSWKQGRMSCLLPRPYASCKQTHRSWAYQVLLRGKGSLDASTEAASTPLAWFRAFAGVVGSSCSASMLGFCRVAFPVRGTGQNLILTFSAITAMSKSETRCPAQLTY